MKSKIHILLGLLSIQFAFTQGYFYTEGEVTIQANASIQVHGNAEVNQEIAGIGKFELVGNDATTIGGSELVCENFGMNKTNTTTLLNDFIIKDSLSFLGGHLLLDSYTLYLGDSLENATMTGGNIVTESGEIQKQVRGNAYQFWVGDLTNRFPITMTQFGSIDTLSIRALSNLLDDGTIAGSPLVNHTVNMMYLIDEKIAGGNYLSFKVEWLDARNNADFEQHYATLIRYNGSDYEKVEDCPRNVSEINPNVISYDNVTNIGAFGVGDSIYLDNLTLAEISPNDTAICEGASVLLTHNVSPATAYSWSTFESTPSITVSPTSTTNYSVNVFDGICYYQSDSITVIVNVNPVLGSMTVSGNDLSINTGFPSYQWYQDGLPISGATNNTYTVTSNGDYMVIVTNASGCADTAYYTFNTFSIEDITNADLIIMTFNEAFQIQLENDELVSYHLYDALGKLVFTNTHTIIQTTSLSDGIYLLKVKGKQKEYTRKLMVK